MGIISWIILGGVAGWIASKFTGDDAQMGVGMNIIVGIVGAFIGGFITNLLGGTAVTGFNLWSLLVAVIGAVVLLKIIQLIKK